MRKPPSPYLQAIAADNSIPIDPQAVQLWLKDLDNPFRWTLRPLLQFTFAVVLHLTWFFKRLPLPQFSAHRLLQWLICWFCTHLVSREANLLILRHFAAESNILNFLIANTPQANSAPLQLYPTTIAAMREHSFVEHDQELFRVFRELGPWSRPQPGQTLNWHGWRPLGPDDLKVTPRRTQILDFESSHALFMCLFCLLLTRDQYRDAINGFNLDQSIAIRVGQLTDNPILAELAYNKYPHYIVGPWNLSQRFLMHGFFVEYLYAYLEGVRGDAAVE